MKKTILMIMVMAYMVGCTKKVNHKVEQSIVYYDGSIFGKKASYYEITTKITSFEPLIFGYKKEVRVRKNNFAILVKVIKKERSEAEVLIKILETKEIGKKKIK